MRYFLSLVLALCIGFSSTAQQVHPDYWDGQVYVKLNSYRDLGGFSEEVNLKETDFITELAAEFGIYRLRKPFYRATSTEVSHIYQLYFTESAKVKGLIQKLQRHGFVAYAEQVPILRPTLTPNDIGPQSGTNSQWFLYQISALTAWDISTGSSNIKVAIVDDAVKINHPDLAPVIWINPGEIANDGIDNDGNGYIDDVNGFDVADNDNNPMPPTSSFSHGTHVAGCAGAATNNGVGVASIGFGIRLIPVKSTDQAQYVTDGYSGVVYAADAGADVINMSWGGSGGGQTGQNIINYARNKGCVPVAAAGNNNSTSIFYPAGYIGVITVAATTTGDARASFSNYGSWIKISAPGTSIRSTYIGSSGSTITDTYGSLQGTSMASPIVAGLCGLMLSLNPNLTQQQIENCLYSTADPVTTNSGQMGAGRIDATAAMQCVASSMNTAPISNIGSDVQQICPGSSIQYYGSSSSGVANTYSWSFPGGVPSTSTAQNPIVTYANPGSYNVTLITSNNFGTDTLITTNYIAVGNNALEVIFKEDWEANSPTMASWGVSNPDNGNTWSLFTTGGNLSGSRSIGMRFFTYQNALGQRDYLLSPKLDFSNNTNIEMTFSHAHRRYSQNETDSLIIKVTTDGGNTWVEIFAEGESGQGTFATNSITTNEFIPSTSTDWCFGGNIGASCFTLDLSAFDGADSAYIMFESVNAYGNNLFLDDISVRGVCGAPPTSVVAAFTASNTTICQGDLVNFTDASQNATSWAWSFQGGTPATSTQQNPSVQYLNAGNFTVSLTATGNQGSDSEVQAGLITVNSTPSASISLNGSVLQAVPTGMTYQWFLNGVAIPGATSGNFTPTQNGAYTVQVTNGDGCTSTSAAFNFVSSIDEVSVQALIYPNPASNFVWVKLKNKPSGSMLVELLDVSGRKVWQRLGLAEQELMVPLSNLADGTYTLRLQTDQGTLIHRIQILN
ncbi:MAG: S8 family serine peptidase [Bacteroidetes bacterium]|nr:S8 family serine peptidase [Bacteroidota bacterium]